MFKHRRGWSDQDIAFLEDNRSAHTRKWLAGQLGRTPEAIKHKITELQAFKFKRRVMKRRANANDLPPGLKLCRKCGRTAPLEEFGNNKLNKDGHQHSCRSCESAKSAKWNRDHPEQFKRNQRTYHLRKTYGLSREQYDALMELQDSRCPICLGPLTTRIYVDHDHDTGRVRGLLHNRCNGGLGLLGDSLENLRRAIEYLATPVAY